MTKEQLAATLNGRHIDNEITRAEELMAKQDGLVVIFGASDDLCELRGAINDESGAYMGATLLISRGKLLPPLETEAIDVLREHGVYEDVQATREKATKIEAVWGEDGYSWTYRTTAPHATFDITEDGEKYCRGIVIDLKEL
jgi:hypothetical protein